MRGFHSSCGVTGSTVCREMLIITTIKRHQHKDRDRDREHLCPILKCLNKSNSLHPSESDIQGDDGTHEHNARPIRKPGKDIGERSSCAFHLRHGVKETDEQDEDHSNLTE